MYLLLLAVTIIGSVWMGSTSLFTHNPELHQRITLLGGFIIGIVYVSDITLILRGWYADYMAKKEAEATRLPTNANQVTIKNKTIDLRKPLTLKNQ